MTAYPCCWCTATSSPAGGGSYVAEALPDDVRVIAPDLRGFGRTEAKPIDATRGLGEMADDVRSLLEALGLADTGTVNAAGWSMGGGVLMQYLLTHADDLASVTLVARDIAVRLRRHQGTTTGRPAPTTSPRPVRVARRRSSCSDWRPATPPSDDPGSSVRVVMRQFFGARDNVANVDEDFLLDEVLHTQHRCGLLSRRRWQPRRTGRRSHPASTASSTAMSPKYYNAAGIVDLPRKPPITWLRGAEDQVISDTSMFDLAHLGQLGVLPGWPGEDVLPAQPMNVQMRAVLDTYRSNGGVVEEIGARPRGARDAGRGARSGCRDDRRPDWCAECAST